MHLDVDYLHILGISSREVSPLSDRSACSSNVLDRRGILLLLVLLPLPPVHSEELGKHERDNVIILISFPSFSLTLPFYPFLYPSPLRMEIMYCWRARILYGCTVIQIGRKRGNFETAWQKILGQSRSQHERRELRDMKMTYNSSLTSLKDWNMMS